MSGSGQPPIVPQPSVTTALADTMSNTSLLTNEEAEAILRETAPSGTGTTTAAPAQNQVTAAPPAQTVTIDAAAFAQMQQQMQTQTQQIQQMLLAQQVQMPPPRVVQPVVEPVVQPVVEPVVQPVVQPVVKRCPKNPDWCVRKLTLSNGTNHAGKCSAAKEGVDAEMVGVLSDGGVTVTGPEQLKRVNKLKKRGFDDLAKELAEAEQHADDLKVAMRMAKAAKRDSLQKEKEKLAAEREAAEKARMEKEAQLEQELQSLGSSQDW